MTLSPNVIVLIALMVTGYVAAISLRADAYFSDEKNSNR